MNDWNKSVVEKNQLVQVFKSPEREREKKIINDIEKERDRVRERESARERKRLSC